MPRQQKGGKSMNRAALIFMLVSQGIITILSIYFFIKVLTKKPQEGSFCKKEQE